MDEIKIKVLTNHSIPKKSALTSDFILEIWQLIGLLEKGGRTASDRRQEIVVAKYQSWCPMRHHRPIVICNCRISPKRLVLSPRELSLRKEACGRMRSEIPAMWHRATLEKISRSCRKSHISPLANCHDSGTIGLTSSHVDRRGIQVCEALHLARHQTREETQDDCSEKPMMRPRCTHRFTETERLEIITQNQAVIKLWKIEEITNFVI